MNRSAGDARRGSPSRRGRGRVRAWRSSWENATLSPCSLRDCHFMDTSPPNLDVDYSANSPEPVSLNQNEDRYRDYFENAKDAIYVHDLDGHYIMVNKAGEELIGYSRDEILQMRISDVVPRSYLDEIQARLKKKLADHSLTIYEVE